MAVGDYARGSSENASMDPATAARLLKGLTAPCGVFAIQGNHDFTFGWNNWSRELKQAGITVLEDQSSLVTFKDGRQLQLSGILDTTRNVRKRLPKRQSSSAGTPTGARFAFLSASCGLKPARTMPYPTPIHGISPAAIPT